MKATVKLEFNLPEEFDSLQATLKGPQLLSLIRELDSELRTKIKYKDLPEGEEEIYSEIRSRLNEIINEIGLTDCY